MAPGFDQLSDHDYDDEIEDIDFSDLKERYDVNMEQGLDTFVVRMLRAEIEEGVLNQTGRRWPPNRQPRPKSKTYQIPTQEAKLRWQYKRWRRVCFHAHE